VDNQLKITSLRSDICIDEEVRVQPAASLRLPPLLTKIQELLQKIDDERLPDAIRRDTQSYIVGQAMDRLDRVLPWKQGHCRRTAMLAVAIGAKVGLTSEELHHLTLASMLHDIGLLMLPSPPVSDSMSWTLDADIDMQCHPRIGAELLGQFHFLREASVLVAHHHERWDGTGYPFGLRGPYIPLGSRILAIADTFDAINVPQLDSASIRNRIALRIIRIAAGTQFDPDLSEIFCRCLAQTLPDQNPESGFLRQHVTADLLIEDLP